jgi:Tfp pilus assembly protein PilN
VSARIGVEIGPRTVRAVRLEGGPLRRRVRLAEVAYEPGAIGDAVAALREQVGRASSVAVAVDLPLLFAKHIKLPPLTADEKRRMVTLEPERFFPVRGEELVVAARGGQDTLVFATREGPLSAWLSALEALGPVDLVEPGPVALARALNAAGVGRGSIVVDRDGTGAGIVEVENARVTQVRRVRGDAPSVAAALADGATDRPARPVYLTPWTEERAAAVAAPLGQAVVVQPLPGKRSAVKVADTHFAALGTALGLGREIDEALVPPVVADGIRRRRRRGVATAAATFVGAALLALLALDAAHERQARAVERDVGALRERAAAVLAMQAQLDTLDHQARSVASIQASRPDPVRVLRVISDRLPDDAYLRLVRATGAEWQISGLASDASSLIPLLEQTPELEGVRFLTAVTSVRQGNQSYESFSLAFRAAPAP